MKKYFALLLLIPTGLLIASLTSNSDEISNNFVTGSPEVKSVNALAFGPDGILFIGDSKSASVFAIKTGDTDINEKGQEVEISAFDEKVASALGANAEDISIKDIAVNPISKKAYIAVHTKDNTPVLLRLNGDKLENVSMSNIQFSIASIENAPAVDAKDRRGRDLRVWAVSDLKYYDGRVFVSGLSNQEFGSTFRSIPFLFTGDQDQASLEIYHGAHGQYETHAPIKTFTITELKGTEYLVASYTCTPLVLFPLDDLKSGEHVKGRTVAEMGWGNSPLDMITMVKDGKSKLLMSNSRRPVMKVEYENIESYEGSLSDPVETTAGVEYFSLPIVNVLQMDKLDDNQFLMLQRTSDGDLKLWSSTSRWL